jgi:hypothetical protein
MTTLTYKQLDMIAKAAPAVDECHTAFISVVMAALPDNPRNEDVTKAIATVLASPAPALESFGNSAPKPEPSKVNSEKSSELKPVKAEPNKVPPAASTKRRREPWGSAHDT